MNRNPVLWYMSIMAGGAVLASSADFANLISPTVLKWFLIIYGVAGAVGGVWVRSQVTPLADPKNAAGYPLVKAESKQVVPDDKGGLTLRDSDPPPGTVRRFGTPG